MLDTFGPALPFALRDLSAPAGSHVMLIIDGPAGGTWSAVMTGGAWTLDAQSTCESIATLTIDQDMAWRLFTKRRTPQEAPTTAVLTGDPDLGAAVLEMVTILA